MGPSQTDKPLHSKQTNKNTQKDNLRNGNKIAAKDGTDKGLTSKI